MKLPGAVRITGRPGPGQIVGYIVVWGIGIAALKWLMGRKLKGQRRAVFAAVVLIISVLIGFTILSPRPVKGFELLCLDVGQGDGFLLRSGRTSILIDGGSSDKKKLGNRTLSMP